MMFGLCNEVLEIDVIYLSNSRARPLRRSGGDRIAIAHKVFNSHQVISKSFNKMFRAAHHSIDNLRYHRPMMD
jgi:hypothetical protein